MPFFHGMMVLPHASTTGLPDNPEVVFVFLPVNQEVVCICHVVLL